MAQVTGIGGILFEASDPATLRERYATLLGIDVQPNGRFGYLLDPEGTLLELWEQSDDDPFVTAE